MSSPCHLLFIHIVLLLTIGTIVNRAMYENVEELRGCIPRPLISKTGKLKTSKTVALQTPAKSVGNGEDGDLVFPR